MKIVRLNSFCVVSFESGDSITIQNCTDEMYKKLTSVTTKKEVINIIYPETEEYNNFMDNINNSAYLTVRGNSIFIESISKLTLPEDFAKKILEAEMSGDEDKLNAYLNFWTLLSLNPNSVVRSNLFWFLNKWGMVISKSGLIVGYRNVNIKTNKSGLSEDLIAFVSNKRTVIKSIHKKSPSKYNVYKSIDDIYFTKKEGSIIDTDDTYVGNLEELYQKITAEDDLDTPVYTDAYTGKFTIRLGHIVSMDRELCDHDQEHSCSCGLHVGGKGWLTKNYFGDTPIRVLVNPADVVAVPTIDSYGKMRVCAYYPMDIVKFDDDGDIVDDGIETGFEEDFVNKISYSGEINNEDNDNYSINIPHYEEIDRDKMWENIRNLAKKVRNDC